MTAASLRRMAVVAIAFALGCGGGGGDDAGGGQTGSLTPTGLWIDEYAPPWLDFENPVAKWTHPARQVERYELVYTVDGGPPKMTGAMGWYAYTMLPLGTEVPELANIHVELRAWAYDETEKVFSDPVQLDWRRGLRAAAVRAERPSYLGGAAATAQVTWTNRSSVATDIRVERLERVDGFASDIVTTLPATLPATSSAASLEDRDFHTGSSYRYRVSVGKDGVWSLPVVTEPIRFSVVDPVDVRVEIVDSRVKLSWRSRNQLADRQRIVGVPADGPTVAFDATSWTDPFWPPWPTQTWAVEAFAGSDSARSPPVRIPPFSLTALGSTWDAARVDIRGTFAPDGVGGWWVAENEKLHHGSGASWATELLPGFDPALHFRVGADGRAHRIAYTYYGEDVRYLWRDGEAWREELVATPRRFETPQFEIDPSGAPHIAWVRQDGFYDYHAVHAQRGPGGWTYEELPIAQDGVDSGLRLAIAQDGTLYALVTGRLTPSDFTTHPHQLCAKPPGGSWSCAASTYGPDSVDQLVALASGPVVLRAPWAEMLYWCERASGAWSCSPVGLRKTSAAVRVASSADGGRVALLTSAPGSGGSVSSAGALELRLRDGAGWRATALAPPGVVPIPSMGFSPAGKLWIAATTAPDASALWLER